MWKRLVCTAILAHASFGTWAASGSADSYPSKPIRIIDGFPAGGGTDYVARVIGAKITERSGQTVIVDNRPGAAGNLGAEITARANADGYTLLLGVSSALAPSRSLYLKLRYDLLKDFSYISRMATGALVLVALQMDDVRAKFAAQGLEAAGSTPDEFRAIIEAEVARWARVIKDANITAN